VAHEGKVYWAALLHDLMAHQIPTRPSEHALASNDLSVLFLNRFSRSWLWFNAKPLEKVMISAVHSLETMLSLVDMAGTDEPMVWLSQGFSRVTGYAREQVLGTNCRFLQAAPTDPAAVRCIRHALRNGLALRVHFWNEGSKDGFWNILSLHPAREMGDSGVRYYMGVGLRVTSEQIGQMSDILAACAEEIASTPPAEDFDEGVGAAPAP